MTQPIIEVNDLSKTYPAPGGHRIEAVRGVSFAVKRQEIFGLLGPNGAGKSTTIGMLTTTVKLTGGSIAIAGLDVSTRPIEVKERIAVVPQSTNLDRGLTARENLIFHAKYFGIGRVEREKRAQELLELMALADRAWDYPADFSGGMARRLQIARALMHNPQILFLDEATTGLDPQSRLMIRHKIRELNKLGQTIVLTTHYMEEADLLCDRVAIMDRGKILAIGRPDELKRTMPGGNVVELNTVDAQPGLAALLERDLPRVRRVEAAGRTLRLFLDRPEEALVDIVETVRRRQVDVESIQVHPVTLEDVFVDLTGKGLRE
jgi:ABC-2 type transport system ATP-binding protein